MATKSTVSPLIVIIGETASGKTALALELAERFNGEIICADSRTVYRYMDIGTAKPTPEERARIPHHLLDVVAPDQSFSAAAFQRLANEAIDDILNRGKLPIMVGGTGLYIDAVLFDFKFRAPANAELRQELSELSVEELQERIIETGLELPENDRNPRHLMRVIATNGELAEHKPLRENTLVIGLKIDREILRERVEARADAMVAGGFVDELQSLVDAYGWNAPALQAPGYKAFRGYLEGTISLDDAKALFATNDLQLAKRQRTWFKRNNSIQWIENRGQTVDITTTFLSKISK